VSDPDAPDDLFAELERRALFGLPDEDEEETILDVAIRLENGDAAAGEGGAADATFGGYLEKHDRVPAFEGADGQPYTVDIDVEAADDPERPFEAFLLFLRWAETGAGIMGHLESPTLASGRTEEEARQALLDLSLYEIRAELDAAIRRRRLETED
jgi:hypothetical protein